MSANLLLKLAQAHTSSPSSEMQAILQDRQHLRMRLQEMHQARKERELQVSQVLAEARARWARNMMDDGRRSGLYGAAIHNMDAHMMQRLLAEANDPAAQASGFAMMENQERLQQHLDEEMDKIGGVGSWLGGGLSRGANAIRGWGSGALRGVGNALAPPLVPAGALSASRFPGKMPTVLRPPPPAAAGAALSRYPTHLPPPPRTPGGIPGSAITAPPPGVPRSPAMPPAPPATSGAMTAPPPAQRPRAATAAPPAATPTLVSGLTPSKAPAAQAAQAAPATTPSKAPAATPTATPSKAPAAAAAPAAQAPAAAAPAASPAAAAAPAAANGKPGFFDTLAKDYESGKLMRNAAILGGVGMVGYGGYKLLQGGLQALGNEHERPPVYGTGAPMPPVAYGPGGEPIYR